MIKKFYIQGFYILNQFIQRFIWIFYTTPSQIVQQNIIQSVKKVICIFIWLLKKLFFF